MKKYLLLFCFMFSCALCFSQTSYKKVYSNYSALIPDSETIRITKYTGDSNYWKIRLRDQQYSHIHSTFEIDFDDNDQIIDFIEQLIGLFGKDKQADTIYTVMGWNVEVKKMLGKSYIVIQGDGVHGYNSPSLKSLKAALKNIKKNL